MWFDRDQVKLVFLQWSVQIYVGSVLTAFTSTVVAESKEGEHEDRWDEKQIDHY